MHLLLCSCYQNNNNNNNKSHVEGKRVKKSFHFNVSGFFSPVWKEKILYARLENYKSPRDFILSFFSFPPCFSQPSLHNHHAQTSPHKPTSTTMQQPNQARGPWPHCQTRPNKSITNHPKPSTTLAYISSHNHYDTHQDNPPPHPCPNLYMTKISSLTDTSSC